MAEIPLFFLFAYHSEEYTMLMYVNSPELFLLC